MRRIIDADAHMRSRRAGADATSRHRTNRPASVQPTAQVDPEPQHSPASDADKMVARERPREPGESITGDDVSRLAEALRAAKQAHSASLAEVCQADAEPVEDWAVWYAEYLLGVR
jgi:hypothetical protein